MSREPESQRNTSASESKGHKLPWRTIRLIVVVSAWVLMVFWFWKREIQFSTETEFFRSAGEGPVVFSECLRHQKEGCDVGLSTLLLGQEEGGYFVRQKGQIEMSLGTIEGKMSYAGRLDVDSQFNLQSFFYRFGLGGMRFVTEGRVNENGEVEIFYGLEMMPQAMTLQLPEENLNLALAATPLLAQRVPFRPNQKYTFKQFNPLTANVETVRVIFGRETEILYRERLVPVLPMEVEIGEMKTSSLVTSDGHTMREQSPLGYESEQVPSKEMVFWLARRGDPVNQMGLIPFGENTRAVPEGRLKRLQVEISNLPTGEVAVQSGRQKWAGERVLEVRAFEPWTPEQPLQEGFVLSATEQKGLAPAIVEARAGIVDASSALSQPLRSIKSLADWVSEEIAASPTLGPRSPAETLATRNGDADAQAELFIALARSAGFRARTVTGLVYEHGTFLLRRWACIQVSETGRIEVDPVCEGQFVDAGYIQIWEGGTEEKQVALTLTNLELTVREAQAY